MASAFKNGKTWTVSYRLKGHPREFIYGLASLKLARQARDKKSIEEQLSKAGLYQPERNADKIRKAEATPIDQLIDIFRDDLISRKRNRRHASQTAAHVRRLFKSGKIHKITDIEPVRIQKAAADLIDKQKLAPRTANAAIKAVKQFATFLHATDRTQYDLLHRKLDLFNENIDIRRHRRALDENEINWLVGSTWSMKDFTSRRCGIPPRDRAILYLTAIGTGFRQRALLSLTKPAFHVGEKTLRPFVRLGAAFNKNGKHRDQPIRADLAGILRDWLDGKPDKGPVWTLSKGGDLSLRFHRDLDAARKAWIENAGDNRREIEKREQSNFLRYVYNDGTKNVYADFHALRHTGITLVVRKAGLKVGQVWADHSTPVLTARYAHMDLTDETKALEALPESTAPDLAHQAEKSGKERTGTNSKKAG